MDNLRNIIANRFSIIYGGPHNSPCSCMGIDCGCGANWFQFKKVIRENDCNKCYESKLGCFSGV